MRSTSFLDSHIVVQLCTAHQCCPDLRNLKFRSYRPETPGCVNPEISKVLPIKIFQKFLIWTFHIWPWNFHISDAFFWRLEWRCKMFRYFSSLIRCDVFLLQYWANISISFDNFQYFKISKVLDSISEAKSSSKVLNRSALHSLESRLFVSKKVLRPEISVISQNLLKNSRYFHFEGVVKVIFQKGRNFWTHSKFLFSKNRNLQ